MNLDDSGFLSIGPHSLEYRMLGPRPERAPTIVMLHEGLGCVGLWGDFPEKLQQTTGAVQQTTEQVTSTVQETTGQVTSGLNGTVEAVAGQGPVTDTVGKVTDGVDKTVQGVTQGLNQTIDQTTKAVNGILGGGG